MNLAPLQRLLEDYSTHQSRAFRQNNVCVTCTTGCAACCQEPLIVTDGEVELILQQLSPEEKEELKKRVAEWIERANQAGLDPENTDFKGRVLEYRALRLPCPLLKDNRCSVYPHRPLPCRMFTVTGPRASCEIIEKRLEQRFVTAKEVDEWAISQLPVRLAHSGYDTMAISHLGYLLGFALGLLEETTTL